jgi:hypothetical protein
MPDTALAHRKAAKIDEKISGFEIGYDFEL